MVQTYNVHNNVERSLYFEKPSELYQIKHCCSNIFLIHCICFGEPLGAAVFELLLNRPDDYVLHACSSTHDKAQDPRRGDMEAQAQEVRRWLKSPSLLSFPNQAWLLMLRAVNFSVKPITQQFLHFFRIFFPAPVSECQKILLFEYTRELLEKGQNQQQTQRSYIYIVTSGIRVQATLIGGDSCSPFLRSKSVIHAFSPL